MNSRFVKMEDQLEKWLAFQRAADKTAAADKVAKPVKAVKARSKSTNRNKSVKVPDTTVIVRRGPMAIVGSEARKDKLRAILSLSYTIAVKGR